MEKKSLEEDNLLRSPKDSGYYRASRKYYIDQYYKVSLDRTILLVLALVLSILAGMLGWNIYNSLPIKRSLPVIRYTDVNSDTLPIAKRLRVDNENEQNALAKYIIEKYIKIRESNDGPPKEQATFIKNLSSAKVYSNFSTSQPSNKNMRKVEIESIQVIGDGISSSSALAKIKIREFSKPPKDSYKEIKLSFTMSSVKMSLAGVIDFEFNVTDYEEQPIN